VAADPDPKPAELIVGRWQRETTFTLGSNREGVKDEVFTRKESVEFGKDGSVTHVTGDIPELKTRVPGSEKGSKVTGKYAFVKDGEIELTIEIDGKKVTNRVKVEVTKDELTLVPTKKEKGEPTEKYRRAKD